MSRSLGQIVENPRGVRLRYNLKPTGADRFRMFIHRAEDGGVCGWRVPEIHNYEFRVPFQARPNKRVTSSEMGGVRRSLFRRWIDQ